MFGRNLFGLAGLELRRCRLAELSPHSDLVTDLPGMIQTLVNLASLSAIQIDRGCLRDQR